MPATDNIVSLDIGTSSVRALLFDSNFKLYEALGAQKKYELSTRPDGSVEVDPDLLVRLTFECLDLLHSQMETASLKAVGVGISTFWHCFLGLDGDDKPTTPVIHLFDTRSGVQMAELTDIFNGAWIHAVTGCMPHTSYWPAKLLWLRETRPEAFARTVRWLSIGEYLLRTIAGVGAESTSMISATGIWDQRKNDYCEELIVALGVSHEQLPPVENLDEPCRSLTAAAALRWPLLHGIPWYPAYGDGACNSIGSGCTSPRKFALMVGTSGAMRVVVKQRAVTIPSGIWCYRVNRDRFILGGAISNGGEVFRWASRTLQLPPGAESELVDREPGMHGLTILPYLAGERSPYWRPELRATITGLSLATKPVDILQACLESVSLRFKQIYQLLIKPFALPDQVIASGGALTSSKVWLQMMADALNHDVEESLVREASSRGAVMIAAEQMGLLSDLDDVPVLLGRTIEPRPNQAAVYNELLARDLSLFDALYGRGSAFEHPELSTPAPHPL